MFGISCLFDTKNGGLKLFDPQDLLCQSVESVVIEDSSKCPIPHWLAAGWILSVWLLADKSKVVKKLPYCAPFSCRLDHGPPGGQLQNLAAFKTTLFFAQTSKQAVQE